MCRISERADRTKRTVEPARSSEAMPISASKVIIFSKERYFRVDDGFWWQLV
jgi:hypothetical protein